MTEIRLYASDDTAGQRGFRTILSGPEHADYAAFCPAPGHGLGINDLKVIEVRNLLRAIAGNERVYADFRNGWRVQSIIDSIEVSNTERTWVQTENHT